MSPSSDPPVLETAPVSDARQCAVVDDALAMEPAAHGQASCEEIDVRFQLIFESSPLAIMYTDADGVITTVNDQAVALFGAPRDRLIGFSYKAIEDAAMREAVGGALQGKSTHFEGEYRTVTGGVLRSMNANFSPSVTKDGAVTGVIGVFEDITSRREMERENEALIRQLRKALSEVRLLQGILPICASCKKVRDDQGYWAQIEDYLSSHSEAQFSHGICPECAERLYPGFTSGTEGEGR